MTPLKMLDSLKWLQPSIDASRDVLVHLDSQDNLLAFNEAAAVLFIWKPGDHCGENFFTVLRRQGLILPDSLPEATEAQPRVDLEIQSRNHWILKGRKIFCELDHGRHGFIVSGFPVVFDSSPVNKATDPWIGNIIQHLPGYMYWKDLQGVIQGGNQMIADACGVASVNELVGKRDEDCPWRQQATSIHRSDNEVLLSGRPRAFEESLVLANGDIVSVLSNKLPLLDYQGNAIGLVTFSTDITELKKTQQALSQAKELAESANHAKAEFLANVSSALRRPLSSVMGIAQILNASVLPPETKERVQDLMSASNSLVTLVDDVLNYSRLDAGQLEVQSRPFDLRKLVEELINSMAYTAMTKHLPVIVSYREDLPRYLIGDPLRVRQILTNLIGNAIKYTAKGYVLISVDCTHWVDHHIVMKLSVEDTGAGIPAEKLPKIFEKSERSNQSYAIQQQRGTGLGLEVVKKFVMGLGGSMGVRSEVGKGSYFWCEIPFVGQEPAAETTVWSREYGALRVLIVDDCLMRAETLLRQVPGAQGLCVAGVDAVKEVVRSLKADEPYHIIFVDHNLQGTSPTQLAEALHKIENCKPLLLLTTDIYEAGIKSAGYFRSFSRAQQTRWLQLLQEAWDKWSSQSGQESRKKEKLRVLMIEDEPLTKKVAASLLSEQFDCDITTASFGQEALEKFGPNFDVVFLDIVLPDMDGFEVAKHMQARMSAENFSVPIIAMTVYEENEMGLDRMKAAGIAAVATKPIEMHFLKALVEKFVFKEAVLG